MNVVAVIPARYASNRLPGKPLVSLCGKPMVQHVWERVRRAASVSRVLVATDDERVLRAVGAFGGEATMTRADHRCGTERVAEVAAHAAHTLSPPRRAEEDNAPEIYVNVQGDEPLIEPAAVDAAVEALRADDSVEVATLAVPIALPGDIMDPSVVKVVLDFEGNALYFSRAPIPWIREGTFPGNTSAGEPRAAPSGFTHFKHIGLYVFRRQALLEFATFPQGELEKLEQLEQLRWLENGYKIRVAETKYDSVSVDVPDDVPRVEKLLRELEARQPT